MVSLGRRALFPPIFPRYRHACAAAFVPRALINHEACTQRVWHRKKTSDPVLPGAARAY